MYSRETLHLPAPRFSLTVAILRAWKDAKVTEEGWLKMGCETVDPLVGGHLHVEFRTPYMSQSSGQKRGNSGVYLQRRYEIQVLDSFALEASKTNVVLSTGSAVLI